MSAFRHIRRRFSQIFSRFPVRCEISSAIFPWWSPSSSCWLWTSVSDLLHQNSKYPSNSRWAYIIPCENHLAFQTQFHPRRLSVLGEFIVDFEGLLKILCPGTNIEDYCGLKDSESKDRVHFENFQNPWRNFVDCLYMIQSIRNWIDGVWVPHRLRYLRCPGNRMSCRHVTIKSHDTKMKGIRTQNVIHNGLRY